MKITTNLYYHEFKASNYLSNRISMNSRKVSWSRWLKAFTKPHSRKYLDEGFNFQTWVGVGNK